jgi:hypothetical protein
MRTTGIKSKSLIGFGPAQSPIFQLSFKNNNLFALFLQEAGERQPGKSAPQNCSFHYRYVSLQDLNGSPWQEKKQIGRNIQ